MLEIIKQYGTTIVTTIIATIIIVVLGGITIFGSVGIIDVVGKGSANLMDDDAYVTETVTTASLDNQAVLPVPALKISTTADIGKTYSVSDLFTITNNEDADMAVANITTELNDNSTDAISLGKVEVNYNGKIITFKEEGWFYVTVDIRQEQRKMSQTFKIYAQPVDISYGFEKLNGIWVWCKKEWDSVKNEYIRTPIQTYPYSDGNLYEPSTYSYDERRKAIRVDTKQVTMTFTENTSGTGQWDFPDDYWTSGGPRNVWDYLSPGHTGNYDLTSTTSTIVNFYSIDRINPETGRIQ